MNGSAVNLESTYAYDADGNEASETLPNDVTTDYTYDALSQLVDQVEKNSSGATLFSESIILNADGTRASATEVQLQSDNATNVTVDWAWGYNQDGELIKESGVSSASGESYDNTYGYDLVGNRLWEIQSGPGDDGEFDTGESSVYAYNARNEETGEAASIGGGLVFQYTYDADGNQLTSTDGYDDQTSAYTYNVRGKMVGASVSVPNGEDRLWQMIFELRAGTHV